MSTVSTHAGPASEPIPGLAGAVVVIGTRDTVGTCRAQLASLGVEPIGCVLVDEGVREGAGRVLAGLRVLGGLGDLDTARDRDQIGTAVVCLPSALSHAINLVRSALKRAGIAERFVPPLRELLGQTPPYAVGLGRGGWSAGVPSGLDLASLIGRRPHELDEQAVGRMLRGKRVLITGAGGSIGSELARLAARFDPERLILMERAENALFEIDRQIAARFPGVPRRAVLHDVVDPDPTLRLLVELRPHAVFHAAAHKHVPLMEDHPAHAVNNNFFGTRSIADAAVQAGAERFVMISSDKAVNPSSVMGATKRLAELYVQSLAAWRAPRTRLSMVRFGNVLGSACSVLTIWSAQLAEGGPITVTDPRMTRYFMTIPEAALLVMQSASLDAPADRGAPDRGAEVYLLDMGQPIPILDLARRFVRAHGFSARVVRPGSKEEIPNAGADDPGLPTIDVVFTGARPGEKLEEELAYAREIVRPTSHPGVAAWAGACALPDPAELVATLAGARASSDRAAVLESIRVALARGEPLRS